MILTSFDDEEALFAAVMAGASGYLLKQIGGSSLVDGIRQVAAGRSLVDPAVTRKLLERIRHPVEPDPVAGSLTAREREILSLNSSLPTTASSSARFPTAKSFTRHLTPCVPSRLTTPMSSSSRAGVWSQSGAWSWRPGTTSITCGTGSSLNPGPGVTDTCSFGYRARRCPGEG